MEHKLQLIKKNRAGFDRGNDQAVSCSENGQTAAALRQAACGAFSWHDGADGAQRD